MRRLLSLVVVLLVMVTGFAFHLRNGEFFEVDYYLGQVGLPFSVWLLIALSTGAICGILAALPLLLRARREISGLRRRLRISEQELANLRISPVKDDP